MNSKYFSKARKSVNFIFLLGAVVSLSCCTSSNKVASSFGKRKYEKGHFADPVASIKTKYNPDAANTTVVTLPTTTKTEAASKILAKTTTADVKPIFNAPAKKGVTKTRQAKSNVIAVTKTAITGSTANNVSIKENAASPAYVGNYGGEHGGSGDHHYLKNFILCLVLSLIFGIISLVTILFIFGLLSLIFGILAIVFFILWILSLA